jgi:hypothetical protein
MSHARAVEVLNQQFPERGQEMVEEAIRAGVPLNIAAAVAEQEESTGRNVFGCDYGDTGGYPPYCGEEVTKARVAALRALPDKTNGVGPMQLTDDSFIGRADDYGGAHITRYNYRVGFEFLADLLSKYAYMQALASYNAGEGRWWNGNVYAGEVAAKAEYWARVLPSIEETDPEPEPTYFTELIKPDDAWWAMTDTGRFIKAKDYPNYTFRSDPAGWLWYYGETVAAPEPTTPRGSLAPDGWVDDPVYSGGNWLARHPTRYLWRPDIEELIWELYDKWPGLIHVNTYYDHPEGYGLQYTTGNWQIMHSSFDVWNPGGRGVPLGIDVHREVQQFLFYKEGLPNINWQISEGEIWVAPGPWRYFIDDGTGLHYDHVHTTYF